MKNPEFKDISSSSTGSRDDFLNIDSKNDLKNDQFSDIYSSSTSKRKLDNTEFILNDISDFDATLEKGTKGAFSMNKYTTKSRLTKKIKKRILVINVFLSILLVCSVFVSGIMGILLYLTGDMRYSYIPDDHDSLGINTELVTKLPKGITNIALFGLDSRSKVTDNKNKALSGLSDSIIVLSVNTNDNTVKLTSILRDSWVPVDGKGMQKLNAAYGYGGAKLAIKTINQNYGLNITDYVSVSLHQLWKVIDFMGGIDIHITEAERKELNYLSNSEGFGVNKLDKSGFVHLDGGQAMTYARIRHTDGDNVRAMRQQKVLSCLLEKAKKMSATEYPGLLKNILAHVETSLDYDEIMSFAPLLAEPISLQSKNIPGDEVIGRGGIFEDTRGGWVWKYNLEEATKFIHKWIYDIE